MAQNGKPTFPSEIDKAVMTYPLTSSQTTAHLAPDLAARDGVRPIAYKWEDLSEEVQGLINKVWRLEELSPDDLDKLPYEEYSRYIFDPRRRFSKPEALDGIRVLEVCRPDWSSFGLQFCGSLLAEHGAEVIKIEDPAKGDAMRWAGPPPEQGGAMKAEGENWPPHGTSLAGFCENRNKYSVTLDVTTPQGREMFKDLARNADVVIENYDPGYLDSLGVGYRQLRKINPRLIYCAVTASGQFGEESWRKGFETASQAMSTLSSFTGSIKYEADSSEEAQAGFTPTRVGWPIGAISGGLGGAIAICGALLYRQRKSGKGQMIDVSSYGLMMRSSDCSFDWYSSTKSIRGPFGNWDMSLCPYGLHRTKDDRYVVVAGVGRLWWAICDSIGTENSDILKNAFAENSIRILWTPQQQINEEIDQWTAALTARALDQIGIDGGFAAGAAQSIAEICESPHFLDRASIIEVEDPLYGKVLIQGTRPSFSGTPGRIKWVSRPMGWDNEAVFRRYCGLSRDALIQLEKDGIISKRGGTPQLIKSTASAQATPVSANPNGPTDAVKPLVERARNGEELTREEEDTLPYQDFCRYLYDQKTVSKKPKMLDGMRLIDFTTMILGPFQCAMLGELGMEVIKLEFPGRGDAMRYSGPPEDQGGFLRWTEEASHTKAEGILGEGVTEEILPSTGSGLGWLDCARNKIHVSLDVHPGPGAEILKNLVRKSDVLVENVRGGTMDQWGIGYRQLSKINPRLVYAASNGPGQWGRDDLVRASYDILAQAMGGSVYITGHPDGEQLKVPIWVADYFGGATATFGILLALYWREISGQGQMVENSQLEAITRFLGPGITWYGKTGIVQERYGNRHLWVCPDGIVKTKDGFIAIGADDQACVALWQCIGGKAQDLADKYPTNVDRVSESAQDEIYGAIEAWAADLSVDEIEALAKQHGFGACAVKNAADACTNAHYEERGEIQQIHDPWYGSMKIQGPVPLYSDTPGFIDVAGKPLGWDTEDVLRRFCGLTSEQINELERTHVIGRVGGAENLRDWW